MAKVSGSYESVVRGVSEQSAQSRRSGQHFAQVNMISDPVRGLARRHGSWMEDEVIAGTEAAYEMLLAQTASSRVVPFFVGGGKYDLIARTGASVDAGTANASFAFCFNKSTRAFVPVVLGSSAPVAALVAGGMSAAANLGRYLYIAGNTIVPTANESAEWGNATNRSKLIGWVRSGAYAREFKVVLTKSDGSSVTGVYKTKPASYPTLLDTSDILAADTEYQKKVNDRVNAYNSAVTAWIGEAAEDITPANIAAKLRLALVAAGVSAGDISTQEGYIIVNSPTYVEIEMKDSGDDSLIRGVGNTVDNIDAVSSRHFVGKVVKVEPETTSADPVYLKAYAKNEVDTGFAEVVWRESAGFLMTPSVVFCMATVQAGTLYIAGSASELEAMAGITEVPTFSSNTVGDELSSPLPTFFNRKIDYLGVFQDRLVVGSGSTLLFSRPGDYLNWFRKSVLSVQDDDPWEGYALGSEDDTIKYGVLYDRSLLLYGDRFQYLVSGRVGFTPATANVAIATAYEGAIEAAPRASGNFVFYANNSGVEGREYSSLHQMQPGVVADVSDSQSVSQQLDKFLDGLPVEILTMTTPNMVLLRVNRHRDRFYVYTYLDNSQGAERLFDSWSYWEWGTAVGSAVGLSREGSDILLYTIKSGKDASGVGRTWVACEKFVRDTDLSRYPYLDSLRPAAEFTSPGASASISSQATFNGLCIAVGSGEDAQFLGDTADNIARFLERYSGSGAFVGQQYTSYTTPTNPYLKDRNGQAILAARLTLGRIAVAVTDTGGMECWVEWAGSVTTSLRFTGRILGSQANLIGRQPIVSTSLTCPVGKEVKACKYTLAAINWLPLTINSIDWTGQSFFNTRRV